jgi:hypothetical protein
MPAGTDVVLRALCMCCLCCSCLWTRWCSCSTASQQMTSARKASQQVGSQFQPWVVANSSRTSIQLHMPTSVSAPCAVAVDTKWHFLVNLFCKPAWTYVGCWHVAECLIPVCSCAAPQMCWTRCVRSPLLLSWVMAAVHPSSRLRGSALTTALLTTWPWRK